MFTDPLSLICIIKNIYFYFILLSVLDFLAKAVFEESQLFGGQVDDFCATLRFQYSSIF